MARSKFQSSPFRFRLADLIYQTPGFPQIQLHTFRNQDIFTTVDSTTAAVFKHYGRLKHQPSTTKTKSQSILHFPSKPLSNRNDKRKRKIMLEKFQNYVEPTSVIPYSYTPKPFFYGTLADPQRLPRSSSAF